MNRKSEIGKKFVDVAIFRLYTEIDTEIDTHMPLVDIRPFIVTRNSELGTPRQFRKLAVKFW